jgi:glycosyltransferase involved in cell wall biosynthesis
MRILLLTQYFPPETGAAQNRLSDLTQRLASAGHEITVLTSMPNYPQRRIFDAYRGKLFSTETNGGIRVLRTWCYVSQNRKFASRLLNYCSFAALSLAAGLLSSGKQDVIVVESPPLFLGLAGVALSRWRRAKMILNVSDLWPQSAVSMGVLRNKTLIQIASAIENYLYHCSYAVTGQTEGIVRDIRSRTTDIPVELITNGVDPERYGNRPEERQNHRARFGFDHRFVVGFTGLHGLAYDFDGVLRSAEILQSKNPSILFAFFGDGPAKAAAEEVARKRGLTNVTFFPPHPAEAMVGVLCSLDAAIIPLKNSIFFRGTLPSRLFECVGAKLPIVLAITPGEATQFVQQANCGICVPPEDSLAMAGAISQLASDSELCRRLGESGSYYVRSHYDRREIAIRFLRLLPPSSRCHTQHGIASSTPMQE